MALFRLPFVFRLSLPMSFIWDRPGEGRGSYRELPTDRQRLGTIVCRCLVRASIHPLGGCSGFFFFGPRSDHTLSPG